MTKSRLNEWRKKITSRVRSSLLLHLLVDRCSSSHSVILSHEKPQFLRMWHISGVAFHALPLGEHIPEALVKLEIWKFGHGTVGL